MTYARCNKYQKCAIAATAVALIVLIYYYAQSDRFRDEQFQIRILNVEEGTSYEGSRPKDDDALFGIRLRYVIPPPECADETKVAIMVTSYFGDVESRSAMRRAFSNEKLKEIGILRIFLLGMAPQDKYTRQQEITNEAKRFGDIVQGNYIEAYRNLTYKHIMGHKWTRRYCNKTNYVIKMDDDIVLNVQMLPKFLDDLNINKTTMAGYVLKNMKPIREPANKWYVTHTEYPHSDYPHFLSGWFYVTTPSVSALLSTTTIPYFWIDDVYVTGMVAAELRLQLVDVSALFALYPEYLRCCIHDALEKRLDCGLLVGPNGGNTELYFEFNKAMVTACGGSGGCKARKRKLEDTCVAEKKFDIGRGEGTVEGYRLF